MSIRSALKALDRLAMFIAESEPIVKPTGLQEFYLRDVTFIEESKSALRSGETKKVRWVYCQIPQLSHGFGSYCLDQKRLEVILEDLFTALRWTWAVKFDL